MLSKIKSTSSLLLQGFFSVVLLLLPLVVTKAPSLILWQEPDLPDAIKFNDMK